MCNAQIDLVNELGYVADIEACERLIALIPDRQARILDAGCGTGLVGRRLQQAGVPDPNLEIRRGQEDALPDNAWNEEPLT